MLGSSNPTQNLFCDNIYQTTLWYVCKIWIRIISHATYVYNHESVGTISVLIILNYVWLTHTKYYIIVKDNVEYIYGLIRKVR